MFSVKPAKQQMLLSSRSSKTIGGCDRHDMAGDLLLQAPKLFAMTTIHSCEQGDNAEDEQD
jgi:hypothetical protein